MTGINDSKDLKPTTERDLFAFKINYNTVENCVNYTGTPLYNGNISETYWRTASDNIARKYGYKYDNLNRLKSAIYQKANTVTPSLTTVTNKFDESLTYDKNGNIISLIRNGDPTDSNIAPTYPIDVLAYTYAPSTNRLLSVSETPASATSGFKDGNIIGDDYSYDANGNMTIDKNKGITAIVYNHLNLPTKITFGSTGNIVYIYNALGQKVQKQVYKSTQGSIPSATYYLGGFQYVFRENYADYVTKLQFIPTAEGYVKNTVVSGVNNYSYVFNYTDHLGNVRLSYQDLNKDGLVANSEILEESNYYPFGMKHSGYNGNNTQPNYKYKFQGQERQDELGLNWDSFKWRNYDYAIGRFMSIDPLAEKYAYNSTYAFQENKMGMGRELEGLELVLTHGTWAARDDKKLYSMDVADYKNGSTWQKGFSEQIAKATGWDANSTYEFTWTGNNNSDDRATAGKRLADYLMSDKNPDRDAKHATLAGHSHGGNVDKIAKNFLENAGWTVDIINIATPQRDDTQTNETGNGKYINFYNTSDVVQSLGSQHYYSGGDDRKDPNAKVNQEITPSKNSWFSNSGGHSYHQDPEAQKQIIKALQNLF